MPVASTRTIASSGALEARLGRSSIRTSPGAWKVTARTGGRIESRRMAEVSKAVLITGCSSGIGHATAEHLAAAGWKVYATARRVESIEDLAEEGCVTLALDVTDEASMRTAVDASSRPRARSACS